MRGGVRFSRHVCVLEEHFLLQNWREQGEIFDVDFRIQQPHVRITYSITESSVNIFYHPSHFSLGLYGPFSCPPHPQRRSRQWTVAVMESVGGEKKARCHVQPETASLRQPARCDARRQRDHKRYPAPHFFLWCVTSQFDP